MEDKKCLNCNTLLPENAAYCHKCGQATHQYCQYCNEELQPSAHFCNKCGKAVSNHYNGQNNNSANSLAPGLSHFEFLETSQEVKLNCALTDIAVEKLGAEIFHRIDTFHSRHQNGNNATIVSSEEMKIVDATPLIPEAKQTQSDPPTNRSSNQRSIWDIFVKSDDEIILDVPNLKATNSKDYILRAAILYLYAKLDLKEDKIPRAEILKFIRKIGCKDTNASRYISNSPAIDPHGNMLRLNADGRAKAEAYIADIFNEEREDNWHPGSDNHTKTSKQKSSPKTSPAKSKDEAILPFVSHPESQKLKSLSHEVVNKLSLLDKSLLALYGISKYDAEKEVSPAIIVDYLYKVFQVVNGEAVIRKALWREKGKSRYFTYKDGYRITPTGAKYIEDKLKIS